MNALMLVTVKLPRNPAHDPRNKVTGPCPVNGQTCTDVTGEHHTVIVDENDVEDLRANWGHITRIEQAQL